MKTKEECIDYIIETIKTSDKPWHQSVWFSPLDGEFIFIDQFIKSNIIKSMIKNEIIIYVGYGIHQGEIMIRYDLNKKYYDNDNLF